MKRTVLGMAAAATLALAMGGGLAQAQTPKKGGTLNFGVVAEPPNYDCHGSTTFALIHPIAPHYSLLVKFDGKDYPKVVPDLAESWSTAPDGMSYTFKLRRGREVPRRQPADLGGHQGQLRPHHQSAAGRGVDPQGLLLRSRSRGARSRHGGLQAQKPDGRRAGGPRLALQLHLQRRQTQTEPALPETEIMGSGPFTFVEHVQGHELGGQAL